MPRVHDGDGDDDGGDDGDDGDGDGQRMSSSSLTRRPLGRGPSSSATGATATAGHLYLLLPGNFGRGAVKVGRTDSLRRRVREYPPGSRFLEATRRVADCHAAERALLAFFRRAFRPLPQLGREYFEAPADAAAAAFRAFCSQYFLLVPPLPLPQAQQQARSQPQAQQPPEPLWGSSQPQQWM